MGALRRLWTEHRLLTLAFGLALALTLVFAARTVAFWVYWNDPARQEMAIEGWMTPGFVAHSWQVDRRVVGDALGLEPGSPRQTLAEIAAARGVPLAEIEAEVMAAIRAARAQP